MVSSGFFNSVDGDRKYGVEDFGRLFDGLITEGVFGTIGDRFVVTPNNGVANSVRVGTGKAWLDHTWIINDAVMALDLGAPPQSGARYDAIVIDVDRSEAVRKADILVVHGPTTANYNVTPLPPVFLAVTTHKQYPIALVLRKAGQTLVSSGSITNHVGVKLKFVEGCANQVDATEMMEQWRDKFDAWLDEQTNIAASSRAGLTSEFNSWFNTVTTVLNGDAATNLAAEIATIKADYIPSTLAYGKHYGPTFPANPVPGQLFFKIGG